MIARGKSMKEIADQLFISRKTVDNHIQHIYAKSGVTARAGATLVASEQTCWTTWRADGLAEAPNVASD